MLDRQKFHTSYILKYRRWCFLNLTYKINYGQYFNTFSLGSFSRIGEFGLTVSPQSNGISVKSCGWSHCAENGRFRFVSSCLGIFSILRKMSTYKTFSIVTYDRNRLSLEKHFNPSLTSLGKTKRLLCSTPKLVVV
jgi:hypothetical protein